MIKRRRHNPSATSASAPAASSPVASAASEATATAAPPESAATAPHPGKAKTAKPRSEGAELREQIGEKLKGMFADVVAEPVPEKFRQLLEQLERKSGGS